jgi:glycosyltransferase involved in cell wall biosynthesis
MPAPRFSFIVPTHEREALLGRCLDAIARLEQPQDELEVIVVDDGGTRPLDDVVAARRDRIHLRLHRQPNSGPAAARNAGAAQARGEVLAFVDDDIALSPGWLRAMERAVRADPSAALGGSVESPQPAGRCAAASELIVKLAAWGDDRAPAGRSGRPSEGPRFLPTSNLVVSAADFRLVGGFDPALRRSEDRELCRRWRASGRPVRFVADATCTHLKTLSPIEFARQHFHYGQGAFAFQRAAPGGRLIDVIEPAFYGRVLRECVVALRRGDIALIALLALWQLANAAGYGTAAVRSRLGRRPARVPEPAA